MLIPPMPTFVFWFIIACILLVISKRIRSIIFHLHVRRFVLIFSILSFLALLGLGGYLAWKFWWPLFMAKPTVEWQDTTVEIDMNPVTPGTGGTPQPVIIQTR
jgi:hypothetical protein